jgi:hypothetical protein
MGISFVSNTNTFKSPLSGAIQSIDRGGERLVASLSYRNLKTADRALLIAFLMKLNGQQHRVNLPFHALDNQGLFGGTPLVNGASQTGTSVDIDGCSNTITGWMKAGDVFSFNGEMKIATADANTSGTGTTTLNFYPRIRTAPDNNEPIETSNPTGVFILDSNTSSWSYRPGSFSDFNITFLEDIVA